MNEGVPNYIVPIYQYDKFIGTGFIVDDTLFTAQHVGLGQFGDGQCVSASVNGKQYSLMRSAALCCYDDIDLMAYRLVNIGFESPLHFPDIEPVYDNGTDEPMLYRSKHFQPKGDGFEYCETDCVVMQQNANSRWKFDGYNFDYTDGGASGSPLIKDNLIYGMLVKGLDITEENAELEKKDLMEFCGMNEAQAEMHIKTNCLTNIYVKGCIIKQAYERDLKNKPEKKILSKNEMFA